MFIANFGIKSLNEEDEQDSQSLYSPYSSDSDNVKIWCSRQKNSVQANKGGGGGGGGGTFIFKVTEDCKTQNNQNIRRWIETIHLNWYRSF